MTLQPLTDDFPARSALSTVAPADVDRLDMLRELEEELDKRLRVYPGLVDRAMMKRDEAERHIGIWRALIADHHRAEARDARRMGHGYAIEAGPYTFDWEARVRELRRELATRRNAYPKWIDSPANPLTADVAATKLARLDAIHWRYWMDLFAFTDDDDRRHPTRLAYAAEREALAQVPAWRRAAAEGGFAAAYAARLRNHWEAIPALIRHVRDGGCPTHLVLPADIARLAATARACLDRHLATAAADPIANARVGQLAPVAHWLDLVAAQHPPARPAQQRKAA